MFSIFKKEYKNSNYNIVDNIKMSYDMEDRCTGNKSVLTCNITLLATGEDKRKVVAIPELPYGADKLFNMWKDKEITLDQLHTLLNEGSSETLDNYKLEPCSEKDFYISYGFKNYYTYYYEDEGSIVFKMYSDEKLSTDEYAECSFDDSLYIRVYQDNSIYYSIDNREWIKSNETDFIKKKDNKYVVLIDSLEQLYKKNLTTDNK